MLSAMGYHLSLSTDTLMKLDRSPAGIKVKPINRSKCAMSNDKGKGKQNGLGNK